MKARLKNGKIVTGRAAEVFVMVGIAEEVIEQDRGTPPPFITRKPAKKRKKRGRPTKK
jgi:hypothetical protein